MERSVGSYKLNQNQRDELIQLLNDNIYENTKYFKTLSNRDQGILEMFYDVFDNYDVYRTINLNMFDSNELQVLYECLKYIDENDLWDNTTDVVDVLDALENIL